MSQVRLPDSDKNRLRRTRGGSEAKKTLSPEDLVSFVPMNDLSDSAKFFEAIETKPLEKVAGSYTYFADGDVLLAKITPCFENGKLGIARALNNGIGFGSSEYIVFRSLGEVEPEFLYYYLARQSFRDEGASVMSGAVGHKRVPKDFIESYQIPVPPLAEQKRIVTLLDEAFEGIAAATANAEQNLKNARELFESYQHSIFKSDHGWPTKYLSEISENLDKRRIPITKKNRKEGNTPYYGASGVVDYVEGYIFDGDLLLVSEDGANLLARTYPIAFSVSGKTWVNNHAHVLQFENMESQRFVEYYLNAIKLDDYVSGMAQPKLNQKALNSIPIPFPSFEKQSEVLEHMEQLDRNIKRFEAIYQQKLSALSELKQSILQKAFAGELH